MSLYDPDLVKDNCGFGLIAHLQGEPSHRLVRTAIGALARMAHRGAVNADGKTGDGCGLLLQKPDSFFRAIAKEADWQLGSRYGVGMIFFSQEADKYHRAKDIIEEELAKDTLTFVGWRKVPVKDDVLGALARTSLPRIEQVFVNCPLGWGVRDFERRLYMVRRRIEKRIVDDADFYISSLSNMVVVYKGLCRPKDLPDFYKDLADLRMQSSICLFHQRFSTNTLPKWKLAQPFRVLAHNGEINTIVGNRQWAQSRSYKLTSPLLPDMQDAAPFVNMSGSDSSALDNMLELFLAGGMDLFRAFRLLIPPAWQKHPEMDDDLRAFYDFNSMHMEPWDGPAGVVMSDGRFAACGLDRNGLRPARYVVTTDNLITLASEVGIWDYQPDEVLEKGRVGPGELLVLDTEKGKRWTSWDIDRELKSHHPYRQWMEECCHHLVPVEKLDESALGERLFDDNKLKIYHKLFGWTREELEQVVQVLGESGQEPISSMGDDTPVAVLSKKQRPMYDYFRQKFAQVTNPPIDPLRENHVMSLATSIGREQNVFNETLGHAERVMFASPVLLYSDFQQLLALQEKDYKHVFFDLNYDPELGLREAVERLCAAVVAVGKKDNAVLMVLSDRNISSSTLTIPAAMAVGAVQQVLVRNHLRCDTNIIVETASTRDPHHFAVLLGFGATAVYPYLVYESLAQMVDHRATNLSLQQLCINYRKGINKGLYKILSKMGISTIASYRYSMLFEAVGLSDEIVELCFKGVASRIGGADFLDIEQDLKANAGFAWEKQYKPLLHGGFIKYVYGGEYHAFNPEVVRSLQAYARSGDEKDYRQYSELVNKGSVARLRDLFQLKYPEKPLSLDEVEAEKNFYGRFDSAAMSIGALSTEAHESLAIAMNRLGGYSNCGEGGEDPARFGTEKVSKIKQIASGRFGVTPHYLTNAEVLQIKMAQGAKPGEGGQLPGHKVTVHIAELRHSVPGVTLISPPPHHDIYSIEDLAQLIYDLKQVNPEALISVKLVSEPGVGTIATGVVKAYADMITISGYDGGTGASPLTSVRYAGSPWELGLAETQQALVANGLRHKIRLQVDGGLKTGLDIVKAAILGAESFGFGTAPLITLGCKFLRICHLNNCATGVATQDEVLRKKYFAGLPERVMNYFSGLVAETRQIMAELGVTHLVDLIGRTDLLEVVNGETAKQAKLDLSAILAPLPESPHPYYHTATNSPVDPGTMNSKLIEEFSDCVDTSSRSSATFTVCNTDRSVGAKLSGLIARKHGREGMSDDSIVVNLNGTAGQSFGVWNNHGLSMILTGDANDYVGKGMTGGKLVVRPPRGVSYESHRATIIGNTCLYGATGGRLYAAGRAGERFCVRNSGARAVVEGVGDNGCEYMTGGVVTILGETGVNFGAGMTGGFVYVLDEHDSFEKRVNGELVEVVSLTGHKVLQEHLRGIINRHYEETESCRAEHILADFEEYIDLFKLVKPKTTDIKSLLGRRGSSPRETLADTQ